MNYHQALTTLALSDPPSPAEVKTAYRKLALRHHPDKNPDDPSAVVQFRLCTEAYNYLVAHRDQWFPKQAAPARRAPVVDDFADIFDDIFGFSRNERILGFEEPQTLQVTLAELLNGVKKKERLVVFERCKTCKGLGASKNSHATICTYCFGSGRIKSGEAFKVCPKCKGRGRHITHPCVTCNGFGRLKGKSLQEVHLPAGFVLDTTYTVPAHDLASGKKLDLFVRLELMPSQVFKVEDYDILCEYPVGKDTALRGGRVEIPGPRGWVSLTVPAQSPDGFEICVADQGLQKGPSTSKRGNLKVRLKVVSDKMHERESGLFLKKVTAEIPSLYRVKKSWWKRWVG